MARGSLGLQVTSTTPLRAVTPGQVTNTLLIKYFLISFSVIPIVRCALQWE